jgi:MFS family permease
LWGAVAGVATVAGPTLGGWLVTDYSWRWIFFVNVPLCLLATAMLMRNFREKVQRRSHRLDYSGAALLASGCTLLILGLLEGGEAWSWTSPVSAAVLASGVLLLIGFVLVERRVPEPVLPLWVFSRRLLLTSSLVSLGVGAVLIGLTSYVPTFVQGVLGTGPLVAGFALATLTVGWPLTSSQAGRVYLRVGFRATALIGSGVALLGSVLTALLTADSTVYEVGAVCFIVGAGLGFVAAPTLIAAQSSVGWTERGVVTGNNMFFRSIGSAVGVALFGAIANATLGGSTSTSDLARASHYVFITVAAVCALMTIAVAMLPRTRATVTQPAPEAADDAATPMETGVVAAD